MDGINRTKGAIVIFMGHIGVPTKETEVRHVLYFISAFCVAPAGLKYSTLFVYCCAIIR